MRRLLFFVIASMWLAGASAQPVQEVADDRILSFEESAAPMEASPGSTLSLSGDHYKLRALAVVAAGCAGAHRLSGGVPRRKPQSARNLRLLVRLLGLCPAGAGGVAALRVPQAGTHLCVVRLRTRIHRLARRLGRLRPRHAGNTRGGDGRGGRNRRGGSGRRTLLRPLDPRLVPGRAAPYGRLPGSVHQRRDDDALARAAAVVAQPDARGCGVDR